MKSIHTVATTTAALLLISCGSNDIAVTSKAGDKLITADVDLFISPDGKESYKCGSEKDSAMGCFTHWVKSVSPDLTDELSGAWRPAFCSDEKSGLCYQGGVAWWYWAEGNIGDNELKNFVHRDYMVPGNDNRLGIAKLIDKQQNCYFVSGRTFCMIRMIDQ